MSAAVPAGLLAPSADDARSVADDLVWIEGAQYRMGSDHHYPEEAPAHRVRVDGFWIERTPVTNASFRRFVEATGYRTWAEIAPDPADYPGALPEMLQPLSLVFTPPDGPVPAQIEYWWRLVPGANWRHPLGPDSSIDGMDDHPVVHVALVDVEAYAAWAGRSLPTEAEWELAARGGLEDTEFAWGEEFVPNGRHMANTWQGRFPFENTRDDGYVRTSPVGAYPANDFGLIDMIGNVWEWTTDWYRPAHPDDAAKPCCIPSNPRGGTREDSGDPRAPGPAIARRVLKGGSHLCAPSYCRRYRPAARYPHPVDTSTSHVGFRCVLRPGEANTKGGDTR